MKLSPTIQLRYDELSCYMFANIIQASVSCDFLDSFSTSTTAVRYSSPYYELLIKCV